MTWWREFFDPEVKQGRRRAMEWMAEQHPRFEITNASLRGYEAKRLVLAVFYREPGVMVIPGLYQLVALSREDGTVEALETSPKSRYWIRGYK